jgi:hypothetical protein
VLESINKELNDKRDLDYRQLQADSKAQRIRFEAERTKLNELEQKHSAHVAKLQQTVTELQERASSSSSVRVVTGPGAAAASSTSPDSKGEVALFIPTSIQDFQSVRECDCFCAVRVRLIDNISVFPDRYIVTRCES